MPHLIEGTREERCKSGDERDGTVSASGTDSNTHNILFGNESFDKSSWINRFYLLGISGILCITVQSYDTRIILCQLK